jgi:uncharacterized protein (TIGR02145 family)
MKKLLFLKFAALFFLGCSNNDDMPCFICDYNLVQSSSSSSFFSSSSYPSSSSSSSSSSLYPSSSSSDVGGSCNEEDYGVININGQFWMAKNWDCYVPGSRCYGDDPANCVRYGRLYNWAAAMGIDAKYNSQLYGESDVNHKGVCPSGWHIPSDEEWTELTDFVGDNAGTKLKGWNSYGGIPISPDAYGFAALPGGYAYHQFSSVGYRGYWWTATEDDADYAYGRGMSYDIEDVTRSYFSKSNLQSVRCLHD